MVNNNYKNTKKRTGQRHSTFSYKIDLGLCYLGNETDSYLVAHGWLLKTELNEICLIKAGFDKINIPRLGSYCAYCDFPEDTTNAILFWRMVSIN
jgi:hypothetical protein